MWTAKFRDGKLNAGKWDIAVIYTDGMQEILRGYTLTDPSQIKRIAASEVDAMNAAEVAVLALAKGEALEKEVAEAPPVDEDRKNFFAKYRQLSNFVRLVNLGLIDPKDARLGKLRDELSASLDTYILELL